MAQFYNTPPLGNGGPELHLSPEDDITVILPDGEEIYVSGDGAVADTDGTIIREGTKK